MLDSEDAGEVELSWDSIAKARLKPEIDFSTCADDNRISEERKAHR